MFSNRDLGVVLDKNMSLETHVKNICKSVSLSIYKIGRLRRYLDKATCVMIVMFVRLCYMFVLPVTVYKTVCSYNKSQSYS